MISIVIADDHRLFREGLRLLFAQEPDIRCVGEGEDGYQALDLVREHRPDVAILDISMPGLNGIDAARNIAEEFPDTRALLLSAHQRRDYVAQGLTAGASGYIVKDTTFDDLLRGVRIVADGGMYLSKNVARAAADEYASFVRTGTRSWSDRQVLTPRETQVLQLVAEGRSTKEAGARLHISTKTVDGYRRRIMEKLGIFTVAGLVKYAIREGLTSADS